MHMISAVAHGRRSRILNLRPVFGSMPHAMSDHLCREVLLCACFGVIQALHGREQVLFLPRNKNTGHAEGRTKKKGSTEKGKKEANWLQELDIPERQQERRSSEPDRHAKRSGGGRLSQISIKEHTKCEVEQNQRPRKTNDVRIATSFTGPRCTRAGKSKAAQLQRVQTALAAEHVTTADFRQSLSRGGEASLRVHARCRQQEHTRCNAESQCHRKTTSRPLQTSWTANGASRVRGNENARHQCLPRGVQASGLGESQGAEEQHEHRLRKGLILRDSRRGHNTRAQPHDCSHEDGRGHAHTHHEQGEGKVPWRSEHCEDKPEKEHDSEQHGYQDKEDGPTCYMEKELGKSKEQGNFDLSMPHLREDG